MKNKFYLLFFLFIINYPTFSQSAGDFVKYEKKGTDLLIQGTKGKLLVQAFTNDIFKVQFLQANQTSYDSSYSVSLKPSSTFNQVNETAQILQIPFPNCTLEISKFPLRIALKNGNQSKIKEFKGISQTKDSVYFSFDINPKDIFHGAGSRPLQLNLTGRVYDFYNTYRGGYFEDIYANTTGTSQSFNIPFIISSQKYGLLFDSNLPGSMRMFIGAIDSTKLQVECLSFGRWAYYLINGNSNDEILSNYTLLTGRQPLLPRWAFGYIQSKFGYKTQTEAENVVSKMQSSGFPLDALVLDLYWYGDETKMGNLDWDNTQWTDPTKMMGNFAAKGVKTILINDPFVTTKSFNFRHADSLKLFAINPKTSGSYSFNAWNGTNALFDIFKPQTQSFIWQNLKRLTNQGVSGFWSDKNEPETHPKDALHINGNAVQVHNLYALAWAKNISDNYRNDFPNKRLFNLIRSGGAGSQRFSGVPWSGDVLRVWSGLKLQICIMVQSGMSGLGLMHSDTGGFATPSDATEKNEELDLRWVQFSTFSPILRVHGQRSNTEPYFLTQPYYDYYKRYTKIRYQLLPYIYTLAWQNATTGRPICLPMDYFNTNAKNSDVLDQYFFGENLVVSPILFPGLPVRKTVLPTGKWFNFWTNAMQKDSVYEDVTLENIPVYAKAGSLIPMASSAKSSTDFYTSDSLTVKFFQDISVPSNTFTMYHDDGIDPNALINQRFELLDFVGKTYQDSVTMEAIRRNTFDKGLANRAMLAEFENITSIPKSVKVNNQTIPVVFLAKDFTSDKQALYDFSLKKLTVRYTWNCSTNTKVSVLRDGLSVLTANEPISDENSLKVYPNPSQANANVTIEAQIRTTGNYELEIFNAAGTIVYQNALGKLFQESTMKHSWQTKNLSGIYIIRLKNDNGEVVSKKVVVE